MQVNRQHLYTVVITQLVGYPLLCRCGCNSRRGGRTPSDPWPPRSPKWSLRSWYSVLRHTQDRSTQVSYEFCFQEQRKQPSSQPASHRGIQSRSSALTQPCLLAPFSGAIDLHSASSAMALPGGVDMAPGRCAGSQAAESRLRGVSGSLWSRCESRREAWLSVPDSSSGNFGRGPGKSTSGLCFASLPSNQTTGAVSLEVNVKVYLNPCEGALTIRIYNVNIKNPDKSITEGKTK